MKKNPKTKIAPVNKADENDDQENEEDCMPKSDPDLDADGDEGYDEDGDAEDEDGKAAKEDDSSEEDEEECESKGADDESDDETEEKDSGDTGEAGGGNEEDDQGDEDDDHSEDKSPREEENGDGDGKGVKVLSKKTITMSGGAKCVIEKMSDGVSRIKNWDGDPLALFAKAGFPHQYDSQTDTILMHFGMKLTGGAQFYSEPRRAKTFKKGKGAGNGPDFRPTDAEYKTISELMGRPFPKEALKVYYTVSADSQQDRHNENFNEKSGRKIAKFGYDQPMLKDHNYYDSDGVFAKIFDGAVTKSEDGTGFEINHKVYMLDIPETKMEILGIESGINNKLSVGIRLRRKDYICNVCNKPMFLVDSDFRYEWCGHITGMELKDGTVVTATIADIIDFLELSRVTVPAQKFAAIKSDSAPKTNADLKTALVKTADREAPTSNEVRNSKSARISGEQKGVATTEGVQSMSKDKENKAAVDTAPAAAAGQAADPAQAADAAKQNENADAQPPAAQAQVSDVSGVLKAFEETVKSFQESAAKIVESIAKLGERVQAIEETAKAQADAQKASTEAQEALKKNVEEGRELLKKIGEAHLDLAQKTGVVVGKSEIDIARMAAMHKAGPQHRQDAEAAARAAAADGTKYYDTVADRFPNGQFSR